MKYWVARVIALVHHQHVDAHMHAYATAESARGACVADMPEVQYKNYRFHEPRVQEGHVQQTYQKHGIKLRVLEG